MIKLLAFDLDGTLTQHKSPLSPENRAALEALAQRYHLLMVGAGACQRIFHQMGEFPIDIIGNYGLEYACYNPDTHTLEPQFSHVLPCNRDSVEARITALREQFGFTAYAGDNVQYHASGCVTFPILGTAARLEDKLAFDPDRSRRRPLYPTVCAAFPEYTVFVGGSSSFDMAPKPYDKYYALQAYAANHGIQEDEIAFIGDDYGPGGNDESVYLSPIRFVPIDDYRTFPAVMKEAGLL